MHAAISGGVPSPHSSSSRRSTPCTTPSTTAPMGLSWSLYGSRSAAISHNTTLKDHTSQNLPLSAFVSCKLGQRQVLFGSSCLLERDHQPRGVKGQTRRQHQTCRQTHEADAGRHGRKHETAGPHNQLQNAERAADDASLLPPVTQRRQSRDDLCTARTDEKCKEKQSHLSTFSTGVRGRSTTRLAASAFTDSRRGRSSAIFSTDQLASKARGAVFGPTLHRCAPSHIFPLHLTAVWHSCRPVD